MDYIFSIGLIPVQEFISEARRSRDLRTGSAILSYIMIKILKYMKNEIVAKIIIPIEDSFNNKMDKNLSEFISHPDYSIPNRASGYCSINEKDDLKIYLDRIQKNCISEFWENQVEQDEKDQVQKEIKKYFGDVKLNKELPFQLIWVAIPVDSYFEGRKKKNKVPEDLEMIGKFFDNVKITRPIKPWTQGAPIGKCTQCGKREAICPENRRNDFQMWWNWYQDTVKHHDIQLGYKFEKSERLCDICALKRLLSYVSLNGKFPSTNVIAVKHWFNILSENWKNELKVKYSFFEELFNSIHDDQELVFYKRDHKDIIKRIKSEIPDIDEKKLKTKLSSFCNDVSNCILERTLPISTEPPNYLSIITYDGDDMGEKVHKYWQEDEVPKKLFDFQNSVKKLIAAEQAQAFYTGGDEGLILCPIETTLKLAISISEKFGEIFKEIDDSITLSMGIIIFDRSRPMGTAIRQAQHLLDKAKDMKGKNALAVGVQTASSNQWFFRAHWGNDWERIENTLVNVSKKILSKGWAYEVEEFVRSMPEEVLHEESLRKATISEIKRISWRKFDHKKDSELSTIKKEDAFKKLWGDNSYSSALLGETWMTNIKDYPDLQFWANQFHLIGFLSKYHIV